MEGNYGTTAEAIICLQERGYDHDFILKDANIICLQEPGSIDPEEFEITEIYRFEGKKRLRDNYIICAISILNADLRGILMTSYARLTEGVSIHLWAKLSDTLN